MNCQKLLRAEVKEFLNDNGNHWYPCKPAVQEEMPQLKYNACTAAYQTDDISKAEIVEFFGQELYDEVALCAFEYDNDL